MYQVRVGTPPPEPPHAVRTPAARLTAASEPATRRRGTDCAASRDRLRTDMSAPSTKVNSLTSSLIRRRWQDLDSPPPPCVGTRKPRRATGVPGPQGDLDGSR